MRLKGAAIATSVVTPLIVLVATPGRADAIPGEGVVSNAFGGGMSYAFDATASGMVTWVLGGVAYYTNGVANFLKTTARPEVEAVWFSGPSSPYSSMRDISILLLLAFVFLGITSSLIRADIEGLVRRVFVNLPAALAGMVLTTVVVAKLLDLTDALSTAVLQNSGSNALDFLSAFGGAMPTGSQGFAALLLGFIAVIAAFVLWVGLLIRSSLIYFLVALSPMAFAASVWPAAQGVLRRLVELLLGVIVSKLVICVALSIGAAALAGAGQAAPPDADPGTTIAAGMGTLLSGTVLLMLACWSPFLLARMIPIVEGAVVAQGISRGGLHSARIAVSIAASTTAMTRLAGAGAGAGAGAVASRPAGATASNARLSGAGKPTPTRTGAGN